MLKLLVNQGDWFTKIDLRDACLDVAIHLDHRRFTQLKWRNSLYQFTCLPSHPPRGCFLNPRTCEGTESV
jgi:hypothetical protein